MKQEPIDFGELSYSPCKYGASRMLFRGPKRRLDRPYMAFIGGTETYGKFIQKPFPTLVEKAMRQTCVNFGCVNGGIDVFVNDPTIMEICNEADMTVVQVMGAQNLSNRFYSVHPRRNDRFLQASTVLQAIFDDVDFSEFSFTRHMLSALHSRSLDRFNTVVEELRAAWLARMTKLLRQIGPRAILLWFSEEEMNNEDWFERESQLQADPLFITAEMIDQLRPLVLDVVEANPSAQSLAEGTGGMHFPASQEAAASEMLSAASHVDASAALIPVIREQLYAA